MSLIRKTQDLVIYNQGLRLVLAIYKLSRNSVIYNDRALIDQMKRSALSVPANISEGFGRKTNKDFSQFLSIALGSINETILYLEFIELEYNVKTSRLKEEYEVLARQVFTFRKHILKSKRHKLPPNN